MTRAEFFDQTVAYLNKWGRSADTNGSCRYRQNLRSGCPVRCAAGLWIKNDEYRTEMEGDDIEGVLANYPNCLKSEAEDHKAMLADLQKMHDTRFNWTEDNQLEEKVVTELRYELVEAHNG